MIDAIQELYGHQAWADAEHWIVITDFPAAAADATIVERLEHLHVVQRVFLKAILGEKMDLEREGDPAPSLQHLLRAAQHYHERINEFLETVTTSDLERRVILPWFPEFQPRLHEALIQVPMHSHYHRGQNATRIRHLGGIPPDVDYIDWVSRERPNPRWR